MTIVDLASANVRHNCFRLPNAASPATHRPLFPSILRSLDVALFLSWLSFDDSFCLFSTLSELFLQNRGYIYPTAVGRLMTPWKAYTSPQFDGRIPMKLQSILLPACLCVLFIPTLARAQELYTVPDGVETHWSS